jgi:hypothetical protein
MLHLLGSKIIAACVAIACVSILSGCWRRRDAVYVDRVHVDSRQGDHHEDHRDDHHDGHHDDHR